MFQAGKEATILMLAAGEFVGEGALAAIPGLRLSTATAITACSAMKISRKEMIRVMHEEHGFSDLFVKFLLARSIRIQADLVDHLFNSSREATGEDSAADGGVREAGQSRKR